MKAGRLIREDAVGAWHEAVESPVPGTIRILREAHADNESARLLFLEEARRIRTLDHPALLRVLKADLAARRPWMLTEPITGPILANVVQDEGPLTEPDARALCGRMLEGLEYLAGRKQVHAYPIPARIVRTAEGWKLLTFRDIRAWDELKTLKGKKHPDAAFAPPERERARPETYAPHAHNTWQLGALLRYALGLGPTRAADGSPRPLPAHALTPAIERLTADKPDLRPQGSAGILRILEGGALPPAPTPTNRPSAPVLKRRRRRR